MIVVTGASGQLGRLVIEALLKRHPAGRIVAAVRDAGRVADLAAQGVRVRVADYDRPESWDAALAGAEKLLLISSNAVGRRAAQHQAVIDAARRAAIGLLAYTSILHADASPLALAEEHRATEAAIAASGLPRVLLRNGWYLENHTAGIPAILARGALAGAAGEGRFASAARADYAEAAAVALTADGQAGRVYELAGDEAFTLTELAAEISRQSGKTIPYQNLSEADYHAALIGAGLPEGFAGLLADSDSGAAKGGLFDAGRQLSTLIGRPTTSLSAAVALALASSSPVGPSH